jgi:hypothetical protein
VGKEGRSRRAETVDCSRGDTLIREYFKRSTYAFRVLVLVTIVGALLGLLAAQAMLFYFRNY